MICNCVLAGTSACNSCPTKQWQDEDRFPSRVFFAYGIDAVEVVRCGECRYFVRSEEVCKLHSNNYYPPVSMEKWDYCSRGEKR